jgi:hypothetical protein
VLLKVALAVLAFNQILMATTITMLVEVEVEAFNQVMVVVTAVLVAVVVALLALERLVRAEVLPEILALLGQRVLLGQTAGQAEQTQAAVLAREIPLIQAQLVTEVPAS